MAQLSGKQIGMYAWNAGIHDAPTLARAIAIAMAESGGNTNAHNGKAPDNSYGLWQINMIGAMGPARRKQFAISSNDELFKPDVNAKAMFMISNGGKNWSAWSTFTGNSYMKFIPAANSDAAALVKAADDASPNPLHYLFPLFKSTGGLNTDIENPLAGANPLGGIQGVLAGATNSIVQSVFKVGLGFAAVVIALVLMGLAVVILMRAPLKRGVAKGAKVAGAVIPGSKVASVAGKTAKVIS